MTSRPKPERQRPADNAARQDDAFEEALEAAEVFGELAEDEPRTLAVEPLETVTEPEEAGRQNDAAFADEFDLRGVVARAEAALDSAEATLLDNTPPPETPPAPVVESPPAPQSAPAQPAAPVGGRSIGQLFSTVVKHSPPSRIRIEPDSVGALFRRFIEQE
ncbi:MAG: hypothetical protein JW889_15590 [Verrucomicrobia bacterium]|nr:hypothetical protein [Verrucomicrobiota bacterium]